MSFWPVNIFKGYTQADRVSKDSSENSTMFYFGAKNPAKKKKKKQSPSTNVSTKSNCHDARYEKVSQELSVVKKHDRFEYYRVPISKNENLHTIAMKFGCSIWELKRANRLWGLQDVHALTNLLVPAPKNSYRAELLAKSGGRLVNRASFSMDADASDLPDDQAPHDDAGDLAVSASGTAAASCAASGASSSDDRRPISLRQAMSRSSDSLPGDCDRFLRTLDADLEQIKASTCFLKDSLPEVTDYLTSPSVLPLPHMRRGGLLNCFGSGGPPSWIRRLKGSGADGGMSWRGAVCLVAVLCLILPVLVYFLIVHHRQSVPH